MSPVLRTFHSDVLFIHKKACERSTLKVNICLDRSEFFLGQHAWILTMFNCVFDITNPLGFIIPATSTQVFLVSLCLQANVEMVPKFPSCYYMPLM